MKKNQILIYNAPKLSFISNSQDEISSENDIKNMNKKKIPKKLNINSLANNDIDITPSKKISDNSMNKLNTKRSHISDDFNSINEYDEKNTDIIYNNKNKKEENEDINLYKNIPVKKAKNQNNQNNIVIFKKTQNFEIDSINEKMIESNFKDKNNYFKKNFNNFKNYDSSERGLRRDLEIKQKTDEDEDVYKEKKIFFQNLYDKITGYNIEQKISFDNLKLFFFNPIPDNKTLITNINIRNNEFKNKINKNCGKNKKKENYGGHTFDLIENIKNYEFDLEILRNHQIYYFGKIIRSFPYMIIKLYISDNFTKYNEINQERVINSNFYCIGKIESNVIRTEFNVYKGNDNINYEKILNINYNINFFGLFGVREMEVNKYENNQIILTYKNELPKWDNEFKFYKLNFNGRVKMICKKNFILKHNKENILQCGKIDDNSYALDFISPLSPFESFCISITSLVSKKACE